MTKPPFFPHLTGTAGLWQPARPGFADLAASSLGSAGTPADGFDSLAGSLFRALDALGSLSDAIERAGTALEASTAAVDSIPMGNIDGAIRAATAAESPALAGLGAAIGGLPPSTTCPGAAGPAPTAPLEQVTGIGAAGAGPVSNLGADEVTDAKVTSLAYVGIGALKTSGIIGPALASEAVLAVTIIGAAIAVGLLLVHFLGHGCGAACIDAAKAEQIYEAAADNVYAVFRLGMITAGQAVGAMQHLWSAGQQHMGTFGTTQADRGAMNMERVVSAEIADVPKTAPPKPRPFDLGAARAVYVSGPGWYPDALQAAAALTDEYLQALNAPKAG